MKHQSSLALIACLVLIAGAALASTTPRTQPQNGETQEQEQLAKEARITKEAAQETALKRAPGTVESAELEREHKKLVWSFDIRNPKGTITEVQVSAITGKIVRVENESKKQEADEERNEKNKQKP